MLTIQSLHMIMTNYMEIIWKTSKWHVQKPTSPRPILFVYLIPPGFLTVCHGTLPTKNDKHNVLPFLNMMIFHTDKK